MDALGDGDGLFSIDYIPRSGRNKGKQTTVYYKGRNKDQLAWLKDISRKSENTIYIRGKTGTLWSDFNWNNVSKEGSLAFPNGKKPIAFIDRMLSLATRPHESDIVLDFFAGSGSTGHAVWNANLNDGGNRKFILVQLPEPWAGGELPTISAACIERLVRTASTMSKSCDADNGASLFDEEQHSEPLDLGFRVFELQHSCLLPWGGSPGEGAEQIARQLELHIDHVRDDASQEKLLFELLLKAGFSLAEDVSKHTYADKTVCSVSDGALLICLEDEVTRELIDAVAEAEPMQFICLDKAFKGNDQLKANAVQTFAARNQGRDKAEQIIFRTL